MKKTRRIIFPVFPGFEILDIGGPASVFNMANVVSGVSLYQIQILSNEINKSCFSNSGIEVNTKSLNQIKIGIRDTLLVPGAERAHLKLILTSKYFLNWLNSATKKAERFGSICTGAFILEAAGLLSERQATTHWEGLELLKKINPSIQLDQDSLYVNDGRLWTSAGASAGIDMALAIIEEDHGPKLKLKVAKRLVLYNHRPGFQSQFSDLLAIQSSANIDIKLIINWIEHNLSKLLTVSKLAEKLKMSERTFNRFFIHEIGIPPGTYVQLRRMERAQELIRNGIPIKQVVVKVGFSSESSFRLCFKKRFGISPGVHKAMHS